MRKIITLTTALTLLSAGLISCTTQEPNTPIAPQEDKQASTQIFNNETATEVHGKINTTLFDPESTEHDLLQYATPNFISQLKKEYGGYTYKEIHESFIERSNYWEHDEPVDETIQNAITHDTTATSQRILTSKIHNYAKYPEENTCTINDNWVKEDNTWKLDHVDDSDCDEN